MTFKSVVTILFQQKRSFLSAYGSSESKHPIKSLNCVPVTATFKTGQTVVLNRYEKDDEAALYEIMQEVLEEGQSYPQETMTFKQFCDYFLSHDAFSLKLPDGMVVGGFYVHPNFPGRASHIANFGLIVRQSYRNKGLSSIMMPAVLKIAKELGYKSLLANLVFVTNKGSVLMMERSKFSRIGLLPKAGLLKGYGFVDAYQYYYDLEQR